MVLLWSILKGLINKLAFWFIIAAVVFYFWNNFKHKREERTFVVSFNNVEGLSRGAPIYAKGIKVGKVIDIFPLGNSSDVGVKGLITHKDFSTPEGIVQARIVSNIESGGGQILEIIAILRPMRSEKLGEHSNLISKGQSPFTAKHTLRLMKDFYQLTKDFCEQCMVALGSQQSEEYREKLSNTVNNTITSLEYGTVRQDVQNSIKDLNKDIKKFERNPNKDKIVKQNLENKAKALKNTVEAFGTLHSAYRKN